MGKRFSRKTEFDVTSVNFTIANWTEIDNPDVDDADPRLWQCNPEFEYFIGDGFCDDDLYGYFTEGCKWDGGDCQNKSDTFADDCTPYAYLGDCFCNDQLNREECGWDGGDCLVPKSSECQAIVDRYEALSI